MSFLGSLYSKENSFQSYSRHVLITCYISRYDPGDVEITHLNETEPCPQRVNKLIDVWVNSLRLLGKGSFSNYTPPPSFTQWPISYKVGQTEHSVFSDINEYCASWVLAFHSLITLPKPAATCPEGRTEGQAGLCTGRVASSPD